VELDGGDPDAGLGIDGGFVTLPDGNVLPLNGGGFVRLPDGRIVPVDSMPQVPAEGLQLAFQACVPASSCLRVAGRGALDLVVRPAALRPLRTCPSAPASLNPRFSTAHDMDFDGVPDACDNCPYAPNAQQLNCNSAAETALGATIPGMNRLGDACDPNPCGLITSTRVASSDRARYGRRILDHADINLQLVHNPTGTGFITAAGTPSPTGMIAAAQRSTPNPVALRRCVCQTIEGIPVDSVECTRDDRFPRCVANGQEGLRDGSQTGFLPLDWSLGAQSCTRDSDRLCMANAAMRGGAIVPAPGTMYADDVSLATLQRGFDGTEGRARQTTTYRWDSLDEAFSGRLSRLTIDETNRFTLPQYNAWLWSRASTAVTTMNADRLRDHYSQSPTIIPLSNGFVVGEPNRCLLTPELCRQLAIDTRIFTWLDFLHPASGLIRSKDPRFIAVIGVRPEDVQRFAGLVGSGGELANRFAGLVSGVLDPRSGLWTDLVTNLGALPAIDGSAFASVVSSDGSPAMIAVGGDGTGGPVAAWYEGRLRLDPQSQQRAMVWQRFSLLPPPPTANTEVAPSPGARTHASLAADPAGRTVALFGGRTPSGLAADLWLLDTSTRRWRQIEVASSIAARTDAAIAFDGDFVFVYGGFDEQGRRLDDAWAQQLSTGIEQHHALSAIAARANARASIEASRVYLYGGDVAPSDVAQPSSDQLVELDLLSLDVLRTRSLGTPSGLGAGIGVADGELFIVPTQHSVPGPTSFVGVFSTIASIYAPAVEGSSTRCGSEPVALGVPCQAQDQWTFSVGASQCGRTSTQCANSVPSTVTALQLDGVQHWSAFEARLVAASGRVLREYDLSSTPTLVRELIAPETITALALGREGLTVGLGRSVAYLGSGDFSTASTVETCGEVVRLLSTPRVIVADTTLGLEYLSLVGGRIQRVKAQYGLQGLESEPPTMQEAAADRLPLSACRVIDRLLSPVLRRLASQRSVSVDDQGTLWLAQNATVVAIDPDADARSRILGITRFAGDRIVGRAVGDFFAVVGQRSGMTQTLQWAPSTQTTALVSGTIRRLGAHRARSYVLDAPQRVGRYHVRRVDSRLEFAEVWE
jgi:hypothetical protein